MENLSKNAALSRLFSSAVLRQLARAGESRLAARLFQELGVVGGVGGDETLSAAFECAFHMLRHRDLRDDYVYRAAITQKLLLGTHSLRTAALLSEFRVGKSKADLAIINGTATAYEIKSERDRLDRIPTQVAAFRTVFASVNVFVAERHLSALEKLLPNDVGLQILTSRFRIQTIRSSVGNPSRVHPTAIFDAVRISEAKMILARLGVYVPKVPNTKEHAALRTAFQQLSPEQAHEGMVDVLRVSRSSSAKADSLQMLPTSLQAAFLSLSLSRKDCDRLLHALNTPIRKVIKWEGAHVSPILQGKAV